MFINSCTKIDHLNPNRHIFNKLFYVGLAFIALFPLVTLLLLKRNMNRNSISAQSDDISTETTPLLHSIRDNSETLSVEYPKWCQFLTKSYRAKFWYWEMLELFRKMIQIFFLTTFGAENGLSFAVTIFISISFAMAHASSKPMAERLKVEHWLQVKDQRTLVLYLTFLIYIVTIISTGSHVYYLSMSM